MKAVLVFCACIFIGIVIIYIGTAFILWDWKLIAFGNLDAGQRLLCLIAYFIPISVIGMFAARMAACVDD